MRRVAALFVAALALVAAAPFAPPKAGTRIVYRNATLIDVTAPGPRMDMAVVTDGERIAAVLADSALSEAQLAGAEQVDLTGRFLLPGFIDTHVHLATAPNRPKAEAQLRRLVYSGVTAVRDMAGDTRSLAELGRAGRVGDVAAPDINYVALIAGPSFFTDPRTAASAQGAIPGKVPWMQAIDRQSDLETVVTLARGTSATAIKIYANLPGSTVAAITAEAHRQGLPVWAHGMVFPATPREVLAAGADTVSHTCYLGYQAMDRRPGSYQDRAKIAVDASLFERDNPVMTALFADMKRRGTILDATVYVYQFAEKREREAGRTPFCTEALAARLTNHAYRAGVKISAGTDADTPAADPWPALFGEFELLAGPVGMKPAEVIRAATLTGAEAMAQAKDMGTIEPGKLANLVVLSADPLASARNLRSVVLTVKRGRRFSRADYKP
jgi:imidazolonepropionase-like amidohydrolase